MSEAKTLRQLREERGIGRYELAEALNDRAFTERRVTELDIARWEEVGMPHLASLQKDDEFANEIARALRDIFGYGKEGIRWDKAASAEVQPGSYVINVPALSELAPDVLEFLRENAKALDLRVALPNPYDIHLKAYQDVTPDDYEACAEWYEVERAYSEAMMRKFRAYSEFTEAQQNSDGESLTLGEATERHEEGTRKMEEMFGEEEEE